MIASDALGFRVLHYWSNAEGNACHQMLLLDADYEHDAVSGVLILCTLDRTRASARAVTNLSQELAAAKADYRTQVGQEEVLGYWVPVAPQDERAALLYSLTSNPVFRQ